MTRHIRSPMDILGPNNDKGSNHTEDVANPSLHANPIPHWEDAASLGRESRLPSTHRHAEPRRKPGLG
jgi:hypothetical protein